MSYYTSFFQQSMAFAQKQSTWFSLLKDNYTNRVLNYILVESNLKAPFSIAIILRCMGGHYPIPWIAPLYPWYVPYNAEYQVPFWVFGMTRTGIEPQSPRSLVNTQI